MNLFKLFFVLVFASALSFSFASAETKDKPGPKDMAMDPMMQKWVEYSTPNENHKILEQLVGNWTYTISCKITPDSKAEVSNGTSVSEMIIGGRFLQHKVEGISMGQPFEGMGFTGYDNVKKHYTMIWFDNMGTGMMKAFAKYYPNSKTFVENGSYVDPILGKKAFRGVMKILNNDKFTYEMFTTGPNGNEFKMLEIIYSRAK